MPNAWESAPLVDAAATPPTANPAPRPLATPAWQSAPVVESPSPAPAVPTPATPAWQSAPAIDDAAPPVPPGFSFGGDQSVDKLAAPFAPTAPPAPSGILADAKAMAVGAGADVDNLLAGAGHQLHAAWSGAASAMAGDPATDEQGRPLYPSQFTPEETQGIHDRLQAESRDAAASASQAHESIQNPVLRAVAPHVLPTATMFIPGVGPELAAGMEAGRVYGATDSVPRALTAGAFAEAGGRVPVGQVAEAVAPAVAKVVGERAAPIVSRGLTAATTGAALNAGEQAAEKVATGKPIEPGQIAAGGATFAAFDLGLHSLSPVFQELARAGGRGMDYLRALRKDFPGGKLPDGRSINQRTVLEAKAAAEEGLKAGVAGGGGGETSSSPPSTPSKTPVTPITEAGKAGVENPSSPPPSPSTTPDADHAAFQDFVRQRDESAFQQFVKERDQRDFDRWLASNKQGGSTDARPPEPAAAAKSPAEETPAATPAPAQDAAPAGDTGRGVASPPEPAPRQKAELVKPVDEAQQQPQDEAGADAAGHAVKAPEQVAPPDPGSVPASSPPAEAAPKPTPRDVPKSLAAAEQRLLDHYDQHHEAADAEQANADHDATEGTGGGATTFKRANTKSGFPREIEDAFTPDELAQLRRRGILRIADGSRGLLGHDGAGGSDAMSEAGMGSDRYVEMVRRKLEDTKSARLERAIAFAKEDGGDPEVRWMASYRETMLPRGEQPEQATVDPKSLPVGAEFEVNKLPVRVVEEGGEKVLKDGGDLPDTSAEHLGEIAVDKGSMREPGRKSVTERLDTFADDALARAKKKLFNMRSGLDPTIAADLAMWAAGKVIAKGIRSYKVYKKMLVDEFGPRVEEHASAIYRQAREIWKKEKSADEVYAAAAAAKVKDATVPQAEGTQTTVRRLTGQAKPADVRRDLNNLAVKLRAENAGAKEGFKQGVASERNRNLTKEQTAGATVPLADAMKARMVAEGKAQVAGAKEGFRSAIEQMEAVKGELVGIIENNLPAEVRGQFLPAIARARTLGDMADVIGRVERLVGEVDRREAMASFRRAVKDLDVDKLSPALKEKAEALLSPIGLRDLRGNTTDKLRAMIEFAERNPDGPIPRATLDAARAALEKKRPQDMTADEVRAMDTVVKNLQAQDRLLKQIRVGRKYRDAVAAKDQAVATLGPRASAEDAGAVRKVLYESAAKDDAGNALADPKKNILGTFMEKRLNPDALALDFDAGKEDGLFGHLLRGGLRDGADRAYKLFYEGQDHLAAATEGMGMKWGSKKLTDWSNERVTTSLERQTGHIVKDGETGTIYGRKAGTLTRALTMTRAQRIHLWAMLTDPETADMLNRVKFKDRKYTWGFEFNDADKQRFLASLTPEERAIGGAMKGWLGGKFMSAQNEVFRRIDGYDRLTNPDYFPRKADRTEISPEEPPSNVQQFGKKYLEDMGQYKDRVAHGLPLFIDNAFEVYRNVTFNGSAFAGQAENLHAAWSVLGHPEVRRELTRVYGTQVLKQVDEFLRAATMLRGDEGGVTDKAISKLSNNAAKAILWKPKIAMKQLTGVVALMADLGPGPVARAVKKVTMNPKLLASTWEDIKEHSGILRDRYEGAANRMISAQYADDRSSLGRSSLLEKLREEPVHHLRNPIKLAQEHGLDLMQVADYVNAVVAYHAALDSGLTGPAAGARASLAISRTQNASSPVEYSGMQLEGRKSSLYRVMSMFTSQNEATYNLLARKVIEFKHGPRDAAATARMARDLSLVAAATVFGAKMVDQLFSSANDDQDQTAKQKQQREERDGRNRVYGVINDLAGIGGGVPLSMFSRAGESAYERHSVDTTSLLPAPFRSVVDTLGGIDEAGRGVVDAVADKPVKRGEKSHEDRIWDGAEKLAKGLGVITGIPATNQAVHAAHDVKSAATGDAR